MSEPSARTRPLDLTSCDREPIHILGAVQPFGFLIAVSPDWIVVRASENAARWLGQGDADLLGLPLADLIDGEAIHLIRGHLQALRGPDAIDRIFGTVLQPGGAPFDIALHISDGIIVMEAEPSVSEHLNAGNLVRSMVGRLQQTVGFEPFCREAVRQMRALTGFDRVMVYRFDPDGSGVVIAESARSSLPPYLGLHYPASDIPKQARDPLRAQLAADHRRRRCRGRRRAAAARSPRTSPRPVDEHPAHGLADPPRIPAQHGRGRLALGLDPAGRQALGPVRLPPYGTAPHLAGAPNRRRTVRADVLADPGEPGARGGGRLRRQFPRAARPTDGRARLGRNEPGEHHRFPRRYRRDRHVRRHRRLGQRRDHPAGRDADGGGIHRPRALPQPDGREPGLRHPRDRRGPSAGRRLHRAGGGPPGDPDLAGAARFPGVLPSRDRPHGHLGRQSGEAGEPRPERPAPHAAQELRGLDRGGPRAGRALERGRTCASPRPCASPARGHPAPHRFRREGAQDRAGAPGTPDRRAEPSGPQHPQPDPGHRRPEPLGSRQRRGVRRRRRRRASRRWPGRTTRSPPPTGDQAPCATSSPWRRRPISTSRPAGSVWTAPTSSWSPRRSRPSRWSSTS